MGFIETLKSSNPFFKIRELEKNLSIAMRGIINPSNLFQGSKNLYPKFGYQHAELLGLAHNSDVLTAIHNSLRREIFRNGFDLIEAKKTDEETTNAEEEVDVGNSGRKEILDFLKEVNENGQDILDVCMELEDDYSIWDDIYLLFLKEYEFNSQLEIVDWKPLEIMRVDPRTIMPIINKHDRPGRDDADNELRVCPIHRETTTQEPNCRVCGKKTYLAYFESTVGDKKIYYFKNEIVHRSKYRPNKRGGHSPIYTVWQKARTLFFMDNYIMKLYDGQRPPKCGLFFNTSNQAGLEKTWGEAKQKARENPHLPVVMGIQNSLSKGKFVEFIDFMKTLDEMQYVEMRRDMIRDIGAVYGVMPIFQADMSQSGGLNNEGLQVTVTNRAVEFGQKQYNQYIFPKIIDFLKADGWALELQPSEEQDEMAKLERQGKSLENGRAAVSLGLEAEYDEDTGEVVIKGGELEKSQNPFESNSPFGGNSAPGGVPTPDKTPSGAPPKPNEPNSSKSLKKNFDNYNEILKIANTRPPFSNIADKIKKLISEFVTKYKRKPSEEELQKAMAEINLNLKKELQETTSNLFKDVYDSEVGKVERELGINIASTHIDESALYVLSNQKVLSEAYEGITSNLVSKLNGIISDAYRNPNGLSVQNISDKIADMIKVADYKAETIARTETSKVSAAARKNSYQKEEGFENFLFTWIGPNDHRTTDTSKRIKSRTSDGVNWEELIKIVEEESSKDFPKWTVDKDFPVSHYNSRHTFIRIK